MNRTHACTNSLTHKGTELWLFPDEDVSHDPGWDNWCIPLFLGGGGEGYDMTLLGHVTIEAG